MRDETPSGLGRGRELTVMLGARRCRLAGDAVVEVIRRPRITRVPHGPPALVGVCNMRGTVLPVVSLARLMGEDAGPEDRVVVLDRNGPVGVLVDAVLRFDVGQEAGPESEVDWVALLEAGFKRPATTARTARGPAAARPDGASSQDVRRVLMSFVVQGQTFALPLASVIEVLRMPGDIARVAQADRLVLGLVRIRDRSLPLVSLAGLLGFDDQQADVSTHRILIVDHDDGLIGLVADTIDAILKLPETAIDPVPALLQRGRGEATLDAIGRAGSGSLVQILSIPKLFAKVAVEAKVSPAEREEAVMGVEPAMMETREKFLVFDLAGERYGLPIAAVDEVLRLPEQITRVPNGPRFVSGLISVRGRPVPIIDQRQRFDAPPADRAIRPRVIIVRFGVLQAGFVVDAVSEILSVDSAAISATPSLSSERATVFSRVASTGPDAPLILLIDPSELLSRAERDVIADIAERSAPAGSS